MSDRNDDDGRNDRGNDGKSPWKWVGSADETRVASSDQDRVASSDQDRGASGDQDRVRSADQDRGESTDSGESREGNPWQRRETRTERSGAESAGSDSPRRSADRSARGGRGAYGGRADRGPESRDRPGSEGRQERGGRGPWQRSSGKPGEADGEGSRPQRGGRGPWQRSPRKPGEADGEGNRPKGGRGPWQRREAGGDQRRSALGRDSRDQGAGNAWGGRGERGDRPQRGGRPEQRDRPQRGDHPERRGAWGGRSDDRPDRGGYRRDEGDRPQYSRSRDHDDRGEGGDQPRRRRGPYRGGPSRGGGPERGGTPGGAWGGRGERSPGRPPARQKPQEQKLSAKSLSVLRRLSEVEVVEIEVEKLVAGGDGFGRYDGIPIFVPKSAPGDRLKVRLTERKTGFGRGEVVEILEPGEGRREPPCEYFTRCGGCDLQHLEEEAQLRLKVGAVRETLRRIGGVEAVPEIEIIPSPPWGYRTRAQLHIEASERGRQVGYYARGSQQLVPVDKCPILVPELEESLPGLPRKLRDESHTRIDLAAGDERWSSAPPSEQLPHGEIQTQVGDFTYTWDARCFFQGNRHLVGKLVAQAIGDFADPEGVAYDLFAGVGLFSLPLSRAYHQVVAVEGERLASRFLKRNAKENGVDNVDSVGISVESWIREQLPENAARVLVDPPRSGLSGTVLGALVRQRPQRLTYVSCQPATLARDLKKMAKSFRIDRLTLLDMFPQTGHMEAVVQLSLKDSDEG